MSAHRNDHQLAIHHLIDEAVHARNVAAPKPRQLVLQRLRLSDTSERMGADVVEQIGYFLLNFHLARSLPERTVIQSFLLKFYVHKSFVQIVCPGPLRLS
jgi:hypothetical protein